LKNGSMSCDHDHHFAYLSGQTFLGVPHNADGRPHAIRHAAATFAWTWLCGCIAAERA
jgi:hypothetical protein